MKKCLAFIFSFFFFSCDNEIPIDENFVVEAFLFQGEVVDDIKIKEAKMWNSTDSITDYIENADVIIFGNGTEYKLVPITCKTETEIRLRKKKKPHNNSTYFIVK